MHVGKYVFSVLGREPTTNTRARCDEHIMMSISEASVVCAVSCLDISRGVRNWELPKLYCSLLRPSISIELSVVTQIHFLGPLSMQLVGLLLDDGGVVG